MPHEAQKCGGTETASPGGKSGGGGGGEAIGGVDVTDLPGESFPVFPNETWSLLIMVSIVTSGLLFGA